ncbi:hypothetical protein EIG99_11005 [Staphylococcus condimenti]|uniref:Polymer-forming cytoskeletal protein n=1 Tax=Staphylococcus condimenti TaxID=70255 RepID=A0A4Q7CK29_9STAP|nr:hypothetical protein [Staphylococcus condimenti]RZI00628.1 hypothetical protein EIG99_11005 [Staphylococcus condimenti]RZI01547.1 hypothetical protein EIG98_10485 [Staphylococcus condimenti]
MSQSIKSMGNNVFEDSLYENISVMGNIKFVNEVQVNEVDATGIIKANEYIKIEDMHLVGELFAKKAAHINRLNCTGKIDITGDLSFEQFQSKGTLDVEGHIAGNNIKFIGILNCNEDCEVEQFDVNGAVNIKGLLNADTIKIRIHELSQIKEIGGNKITIYAGNNKKLLGLVKIITGSPRILECESIEGDDIDINDVRVSVVRGKNIKIGDNVKAGHVEYSDSIDISSSAYVKECIQI